MTYRWPRKIQVSRCCGEPVTEDGAGCPGCGRDCEAVERTVLVGVQGCAMEDEYHVG